MASPSRLLRSKQSPPLPSQFDYSDSNKLSASKRHLSKSSEMLSAEVGRRPQSAHARNLVTFEITNETVKDYLRSHKSFMEDYLLNEVPVVALQKILTRKTCRRDSGYEVASTIGDAITQLKTPQTHTVMGTISSSIQKGIPVQDVLLKLCKSTSEAAYADCFHLYLMKSNYLELVGSGDHLTVPVRLGDTIPGYVAASKTILNINLLKQRSDFKYPKGSLLSTHDKVGFILCVPIVAKAGSVIGVLELGRKVREFKFTEEDEEIVKSYLSWGTVAIDCSNIHVESTQLHLLFDTFHGLIRKVIGKNWTFESLFESIRLTVCDLVSCETVKIFMASSSGGELCLQHPGSNLYDRIISSESNEAFFIEDLNQQSILSQSDIVFPGLSIVKRIVDHSANTKEVLNLNDVTRRKFLTKDMDSILAADSIKSVLCTPISIDKETTLGAIVAINKKNKSEFSAVDQEHFISFAEFCSLVLGSCKFQREIKKMENKCEVMTEILEFHRGCSDELYEEIKKKALPQVDDFPINDFGFDTATLDTLTKAQLAVTLFKDLVNPSGFDGGKLIKFCLTVSKNYRPIPYHNWEHAFSVAHCMYLVIKNVPQMFSEIEKMALYVACLCHDLDHRGTNSSFLAQTESPLALLYTDPIIEHHHFSQTIALLKMDSINIFSHFSKKDYAQVMTIINKAIMASDIMQFFKNRESMMKLVGDGRFTWSNPAHKEVALRMLITMCDLNSTFKPWEVYKAQVDSLFEEFYEQGDREKELGSNPIDLMNRDASHKIADIQMNFIGTFSLASCQLLEPFIPQIKKLREGAEANVAKWRTMSATASQWKNKGSGSSTPKEEDDSPTPKEEDDSSASES